MPPHALRWGLGLLALGGVAVTAADLTVREKTDARRLYVAKCAKCHGFYDPTHYAEPDWRRWMGSMSRKSKLKPAQETLLNRYLDAYRTGQIPHPPHRAPKP
jgi:cytochrome c553